MGAVIQANIFGELVLLMAEMDKKSKAFASKFDCINSAMLSMGLPEDL